MEYKLLYNELLTSIEKRIKEYVIVEEPKNLYEPIEYIMSSGGKRIRPVLAMIACGIVSEQPYNALNTAVALELLHNFTLVHDDIMDDSPIRRGRTTIHVKWTPAIAILAGDAMIALAYRLLPKSASNDRSDCIIQLFTNEIVEVCEGQVLDMDFNTKKDVTIEEYINMIDKKTARLLETCVSIGANIGMGTIDEVFALKKIAHNVGIAFQIQDDYLDLTADVEKLGKRIGGDIIEGKKTYFVIKAKLLATENKDKELLNKFYSENGLDASYVPKMVEMFSKLNLFDIADLEINSLFSEAYSEFSKLKQNKYTDTLKWILEGIQQRNF